MDWYRSRDVGSTLILAGAAAIALLFLGRFVPEGLPRIAAWVGLFLLVSAFAPAPWVAPPAALATFLLAIFLTAPPGDCAPGYLCQPISGSRPVLLGSLVVALSSVLGATIRWAFDLQHRRKKAQLEAGLPPI